MLLSMFAGLGGYLTAYSALCIGCYLSYWSLKGLFFSDQQTLQDYFRHFYLIGKTGCGKSTTIRDKIFIPWIQKGYGGMVIETKDKSTIDDILNCIPLHRHKDVIVFDVDDMAQKKKWIGLNLFEDNYNFSTSKTLICGEVLSILKRHFGNDSIQARSEDYFRNAFLAVLEKPNSTILDVYKILTNEEYRSIITEDLSNLIINDYYKNQFENKKDSLIAPLNKLRAFLSNPMILNILSQPQGLNIRQIMDDQKILIVQLPKGIIGEDTSRLLASAFLSKVQLSAQSRANIPKSERFAKPFMVVADEFQDYANSSFNDFLEQSRAFGISLVIAHQLLQQKGINDDIIASIKGNVGNYCIFKCGVDDVTQLAKIVNINKGKEQTYDDKFIKRMPNHTYIKKLTCNGREIDPIIATNEMPVFLGDYADMLRRKSLERYAVSQKLIEQNLEKSLKQRIEEIKIESEGNYDEMDYE